MRTRSWVGMAAAALVAAGALSGPATAAPARAALAPFPSCAALVGHLESRALALAGRPGMVGGPADGAAPARAAAPEAGVDFSGTNVQEEGVDEPDLVKTDGRRLFAVGNGRVQAFGLTGGAPRRLGTLAVPGVAPAELLLVGDRLMVVGTPTEVAGAAPPAPSARRASLAPAVAPRTALVEVDVADPGAMRAVKRLTLDGAYVSARLAGTTARLVVSSGPRGLPLGAADPRGAIRRSRPGNWIPRVTRTLLPSGRSVTRRAVPCREVARPREFAGLGMVSVVTVDLSAGMAITDADAVLTDGQLVYASPAALYVASTGAATTLVHKLDTAHPTTTEHRASGSVPGHLLNQFALSEHEGVLRAATTEEPPFTDAGADGTSQSFVTALAERAGVLRRVGQVGGLGRGERIFAVRFLGARGYVVTFRQVDPLYVLDLADPAAPVVRGELKIPGYSAYLHPAGEGRLVGVGQDADAQGRVRGTQVALFDVSDPARPRRIAQQRLGAGYSEAEGDHRAFLYWAPTGLLVVPFAGGEGSGRAEFTGAVGFGVSSLDVRELGRVAGGVGGNPSGAAAPRRALVAGDALVTVSDAGVRVSALDTLADRGFTPFG